MTLKEFFTPESVSEVFTLCAIVFLGAALVCIVLSAVYQYAGSAKS
jgi:hypothetical protein